MSKLLKRQHRQQLSTWIGKPSHFELLYKISSDGCSGTKFHQMCDNKGPTVTVLYNSYDSVYGGYLSNNWDSNGTWIRDDNAFLFRLQFNGSISDPVKFEIINAANAAWGDIGYGPIFGPGNDMRAFEGTVVKSGNAFNLNGHIRIGNGYNSKGHSINSIANGNMNVTDLEIYLVKDGPGKCHPYSDSSLLQDPWRKDCEWNKQTAQQLREKISDYKVDAEFKVDAANVLLIGQIGAGKSSFFNSVNSIFRQKITSKAMSGSLDHSVTTAFRKYAVKDVSSGTNLRFHLCDTRGVEEEFLLNGQEITYILDGHVPDRYQFNPLVPFSAETFGYVKNPSLDDKIHCVAFVIDGSTIEVIPEKILQHLKDLRCQMIKRSLPQIVLMTKIDKLCPDVEKDVSNTFKSTGVQEAVNKVAEVIGIPRGHVLPIKNYENETDLENNIDILILKALKQTLNFADDYMEEQVEKVTAEKKIK